MAKTKNKMVKGKKMVQKQQFPQRVQVRMQVPRMVTTTSGLRVRNRELVVGNVGATNQFRGGGSGIVTSNGVDAAYGSIYLCPSAFNWLGHIGQAYANYRFHSLRIYYVPQIATTSNGLVSFVTFANADDGPNNTNVSAALRAAEVGQNSIQGPAWDPNLAITHDCSRYREPKPNIEYNLIGTSGTQGIYPRNYPTSGLLLWWYQPSGVVTAGRLYAEYDVELLDPVSPETGS
jgi:hypothetical protein